MNERPFVEVFVEDHCPSCEAIVRTLKPFAENELIFLRIYQKGGDDSLFAKRNVTSIPTTYVNGRAAFHGEFTRGEFRYYLFRHQAVVED
jgi:hypothetical protein